MDRSLTWQSGKPSVGDDCVMSRADRSDIAVLLSPRSSNFIARAVKFNEADNEKYENFCTQIEEFAIVGRVFWNTFHLLARTPAVIF
ncbi:hypothetical protein OUZ56_031558 [Daphnia magna]|uniref:Uncharacterized protein n=1 Tax=Daphnia magna TaxID=35525 RepID=A0ABQ9ZVN5_9CRUS|nr:hypothetical protein OUZ56_031558 [Daphnia magna]